MELKFWKRRESQVVQPAMQYKQSRSLRQQAFSLFDLGKNYREICNIIPIKLDTARRYYFVWKKLPKNFEGKYRMSRNLIKKDPDLKMQIAEAIAGELQCSIDEIIAEMEKPWATHKLARGYWKGRIVELKQSNYVKAVRAAARFVSLYINAGVPIDVILQALNDLKPDNPNKTG